MAVDGSITISTNLDNTQLQRDASKLKESLKAFGTSAVQALSGSSKATQSLRQKIAETNLEIEETKRKMREIAAASSDSGSAAGKAYENAKLKVEQTRIALGDLENRMAEIAQTAAAQRSEFFTDPQALDAEVAKALESDKAYQRLGARYDTLGVKLKQQSLAADQAKQRAVSSAGTQSTAYKKLDDRLSALNLRLRQYGSRLANSANNSKASAKATGLLSAGVNRFGARLGRLAAGVFVFNLLRKGFTELRNYLGATLKTNDAFNSALAKTKGNLLIAFQPIYEAIVPHIINFVKWLQKATAYVAVFTSALVGKTVQQSAKAAKNLDAQAKALKSVASTAKEASGALAGFDEINRVDSGGLASGADLPSVDFSGVEIPESSILSIETFARKVRDIWSWIVENQPIVSTAISLFGFALLGIFGPNVVSKIAGFILLFQGVGKIIETIQQIISDGGPTWETFIGVLNGTGLAVIGLGLILGKPKVAGFGLILWGISEILQGFTDILAGNGDAWENLKRVMFGTGAAVVGAFIVFGVSVGIAALAIGAFVLAAAAIASVWGKLSTGEKVLAVLALAALAAAAAIAIFHTAWTVGLAAAAIGLALAGLATTFVLVKDKMGVSGGSSDLSLPSGSGRSFGGRSFEGMDFSGSPLPHLASGAVLPANKEFAAVLSDQRYGKNIETPEKLLRQIFREEINNRSEDGDINLNASITLDDGTVVGRLRKRINRSGRVVNGYS